MSTAKVKEPRWEPTGDTFIEPCDDKDCRYGFHQYAIHSDLNSNRLLVTDMDGNDAAIRQSEEDAGLWCLCGHSSPTHDVGFTCQSTACACLVFRPSNAQPPEHDAGLRDQTALCEDHDKPICDECGYCIEDPEHQKHVAQSDTGQPRREMTLELRGTMCTDAEEKVDGLKLVGSLSNGQPELYAFVSPDLTDELLRRFNAHESLIAALEQMHEQFSCHTCKYHGPMVCDKCEALKAADAALRQARDGEIGPARQRKDAVAGGRKDAQL